MTWRIAFIENSGAMLATADGATLNEALTAVMTVFTEKNDGFNLAVGELDTVISSMAPAVVVPSDTPQ